jgi:hypothetical protein
MLELTSSGATQMVAALELHAIHMEHMSARLEKASDLIYEETAHRFDTEADGQWPPLTESTIAKKESQGYGEPAKPLFAEGNLYESATSPNGPYSLRLHVNSTTEQKIVILVDWANNGWQIPTVLAEGNDPPLAARPIWPPAEEMRDRVGEILLAGL